MKIDVEFVGAISSGKYDKNHQFNFEEGTTVGDFLNTLHFSKSHVKFIQVVRNGTRVPHSQQLSDGDKLELMLMVGGG